MYQEFKLSKRNKLLGDSAQGWSSPAHVINVRSLLIRISPHLCFIPHLKCGLCKAEYDVGTCPYELYMNSVPWENTKHITSLFSSGKWSFWLLRISGLLLGALQDARQLNDCHPAWDKTHTEGLLQQPSLR